MQDKSYGARAERGVVLAAEAGGWRVRSLDRPGVETGPLFPIGAAEISVGDVVWFLLAGDGQGVILRSAPAGGISETAARLQTPRKIALTGDASGSAMFDGSADITIETEVPGVVRSVNGNRPDGDGNVVVSGGAFDPLLCYPVGSIYISVAETSPALIFGGTWDRITGHFLLGATDGGATGDSIQSNASVAAGSSGGEATHKLNVNEMPSHTHPLLRQDASGSESGNRLEIASGSRSRTTINYGAFATGGSQAHNNMPPFLAVYMWKRTA